MAFLERLKTRRSHAAADHAPPVTFAAPKLRTRITELSQLFFPARSPRKLAPSAPHDGPPPDPAKIVHAEDGGAARPAGRREEYDRLREELLDETADIYTDNFADAARLTGGLSQAVIDLTVARTRGAMMMLILTALMLGLVGSAAAYASRTGAELPAGGFGMAAAYFLVGTLAAVAVLVAIRISEMLASGGYGRVAGELAALVRETTRKFHDSLVEMRSQMEANSASDFPSAIESATRARLTTISALRFFDQAPVISSRDEGYRCKNIGAAVQQRARDGLVGELIKYTLVVFGLGALYVGAALLPETPAPMIVDLKEVVASLRAAEAASPGKVSIPLAIAAAFIGAIFLGRVGPLASAAIDPLNVTGLTSNRRSLAGLHARLIADAAERNEDLIERYCDALISLQNRTRDWAKRENARNHTAEDDVPSWRRPPEGPRFVDTGFQAAPVSFTADPKSGRLKGRDEKNLGPATGPKRGLFSLKKP